MSNYDRFQPESYEDFLFRGKTVIERREIAQRLRDEDARAEREREDDEARAEERRAANNSTP